MRRTITVLLILCLLTTFFTACNAPSETLTEGELTLEIYLDSNGKTETIKTYKNGKRVDSWRVRSSARYNEAPVSICDVNFDGHDDLRILVATGSHLRYAHRIYDAETGTFYTDEQLDKLLDATILPEQKQINASLKKIAQKLGVGLVATGDVHYLKKSDAEMQAVLT